MIRSYDREGIRFATWVGHGRDPEVAYLDGSQLVIGSAELRIDGWHLFADGAAYNTLGGVVAGPIDPAILHRISHASLDAAGAQWLQMDGPDAACGEGIELCAVALRHVQPGTPYHQPGSFHLEADFAVHWVTWEDAGRAGTLRRAVYADDRFLLEAAIGRDGGIRIWPARGLRSFDLELVTPSPREAVEIEARVSRATATR